ncbi:hypothetical protein Tco_0856338 [Tanacetum coccineum]|uniref:Uncharacterized protein n=1 Tax=Tanacetum coccineum TaxID=301880 RepID=A0ABQ5B3U7_9ASTR
MNMTEDLDTYDSDCDDISNAKAVLMANISNYGSDVISEEKANKEQNNESVTAELERYKERVKTFKQRLNIDLSSREKMIDSQMDDMIKEKLALKEQVDSLEQNLSKQFKKKECLLANQSIKPSIASPVKIEAPKELPKVSLVNERLKKLKFHLARFDNVVKIRTTPDARIEDLLNEIMEVHIVFDHMDAAVQQSSVDKQCLEIAKKELLLENDRLLQQIMSQDVLLTAMNSMSLITESVNMERKRNESCDKCFNLDAELLKSQNAHNDLLKSYSQPEKHCISLELSIQLNQEIFQKDKSCNNQNALEIPEFFENYDLKAQLQDKRNIIVSEGNYKINMRENIREENVNMIIVKLTTKNVELENRKEIVDIAAQIPSANTIVLGMFKLDLEPLAPRLLQNREAYIDYLKYTQEQADIL